MATSKWQLVFDLTAGRISQDQFIAQFGTDPRIPGVARQELEQAYAQRRADDVEAALILANRFALSKELAPVLCNLLEADWHMRHEDIAKMLQAIQDPSTVDCLYRAALKKHAYLAYDNSAALARKCTWALYAVGTPEAFERLEALAQSDEEHIRGYAQKRLDDRRPR